MLFLKWKETFGVKKQGLGSAWGCPLSKRAGSAEAPLLWP